MQKQLENYKLPTVIADENGNVLRSYNGKESKMHIFRYVSDLVAQNLNDGLRQELDRSQYLIVICSPRSAKGNYADALEYYNKALEIWQEFYGERHPNVAICYHNIGLVLKNQGNYSEALEYYKKSLEINKEIYGERHPDVADLTSFLVPSHTHHYLVAIVDKNSTIITDFLHKK